MKSLHFTLPHGFRGGIISDSEFSVGERENLLLNAYVPGYSQSSGYVTPSIRHCESANNWFTSDDNLAIWHGIWNHHIPLDAIHLLAGITRKQYLTSGFFVAHAACVGLDDLILLPGHSGSGKTAIALELMKRHGMRLYSGNTTVMQANEDGTLTTIAGTKTITAKTTENKHSGIPYGDRAAFMLADHEYAQPEKIKAIALVRLNDGRQDCTELSPDSALHTLYPLFMDTVHADVLVAGKVFDGSISNDKKELLAHMLRIAVERTPAVSLVGSLDYIVDSIARLFL